jgi:alginate O-acetyltransferase complex protein AlgI
MSLTSMLFWIFLLACLAVYWLGKGKIWQNVVLLVASLIIFVSYNPVNLLLLVFSIVFDYWISFQILNSTKRKRQWLWFGLVVNIGVWLFYKYAASIYLMLWSVEAATTSPLLHSGFSLLMPLGLSFITLKKIAYLLDLYHKRINFKPDLLEYACFVAFFPQLIAGPIDRAQKLIPQLKIARMWQPKNFEEAWPLILNGMFKKVVIADGLGVIVTQVYLAQMPSKLLLFIGTFGFAIQLLADFSGYTDMSRGVARLLGFETPINFNAPYLSLNFNEFWNRWHITLSSWLRDYVFFPLRRWLVRYQNGKNSWLAVVLPPLVTMLVSGIWHGTGWNFIAWGLFHGIVMAVSQLLNKSSATVKRSMINTISSWLVTNSLLLFSWALFCTTSLTWLLNVILHSPMISGPQDRTVILSIIYIVLFYLVLYLLEFFIHRWTRENQWVRTFFYTGIAVLIFIYSNSVSPDFIYTHF